MSIAPHHEILITLVDIIQWKEGKPKAIFDDCNEVYLDLFYTYYPASITNKDINKNLREVPKKLNSNKTG